MIVKPKGIVTAALYLEDNSGKLHNLTFKVLYYLPVVHKLLVIPQKWTRDRGEDKVVREGKYLKVMVKRSILVWNNSK